jgi:hypothetical protein
VASTDRCGHATKRHQYTEPHGTSNHMHPFDLSDGQADLKPPNDRDRTGRTSPGPAGGKHPESLVPETFQIIKFNGDIP